MTYPLPPRPRRNLQEFGMKDQLGEGSLSTVYRAFDCTFNRPVAMKVFDRAHLRSQKKDADVTMEEHCLRRVNHPCIVKLYASFREESAHYFVLEHCPFGELWHMSKNLGCPPRLARHYLAQLLEAIGYLRDARIVHRDIKAENVLIGEGHVAKLIDFGSAKDLCNPHIKGAGTPGWKKVLEDNVGTPNFMAPEVVNNKRSDFRSDIWSLGCTIFQVTSGMPPFASRDLCRVYKKALACRLDMDGANLEDHAHDIVVRMVVPRPDDRLGGRDFSDLRRHPFFSNIGRSLGPKFQGAHRVPPPVMSLEELCLRSTSRSWHRLASEVEERGLVDAGENTRSVSLRADTRSVLRRLARAAIVNSPDAVPTPDTSDDEGSCDRKK